ncbi:LpxA family transferase [Candidatus Saccharibacteria bacterium]|nr:LpxA family transferase [Candidatus Saccharibacteria bacterium]
MKLTDYCAELLKDIEPWILLTDLEAEIKKQLSQIGDEYVISDDVAVHKAANVDPTATIKAPAIISAGCFIGPHTLLRGGVYLHEGVSVGPSCEVKHSIVGSNSTFAHFNFLGDSVIGARVNFEAGAITANHYNERKDKMIHALVDGKPIETGVTKFGALIGDGTKVGANAVTSPGTILAKNSVVKRLELVEQIPQV